MQTCQYFILVLQSIKCLHICRRTLINNIPLREKKGQLRCKITISVQYTFTNYTAYQRYNINIIY